MNIRGFKMKEFFEKEAMSLATEVTDNSNDELSES